MQRLTAAGSQGPQIGLFGLTMIAAGACIGSGIFVTPSDVASHLGSTGAILGVWALGGVVAFTGALTFAELAGRFTGAGGVYVYLRECYGRLWAFLYGWCILTVITSGAIAALSLTFARYLSTLVPLGAGGQVVVGISAIIAVTIINILGIKPGEIFSSLFTLCKLVGIACIVLAGVFLGMQMPGETAFAATTQATPAISGFALAMIGVLWSYGGWHHASYVAAEVRSSARIVPRAMIFGALIVTTTYILSNWAYLRLLPVEAIASSVAVAADAMRAVLPAGALFVTLLIMVSTFGSIGIFTLTAPRIYQAMAVDGSIFRQLSQIHPRHQSPVWAIGVQSGWAVVLLILWSTFENLITYVVFMDWVFMILAASSIFIFRRSKSATAYTGFRVPWYPLPPLIFLLISCWFVIYTLIGKPGQAIAGIILLVIGIPVYVLNRRSSESA